MAAKWFLRVPVMLIVAALCYSIRALQVDAAMTAELTGDDNDVEDEYEHATVLESSLGSSLDDDDPYSGDDDNQHLSSKNRKSSGGRSHDDDDDEEGKSIVALYDEPRMDNATEETVWAVLGKPADLNCQVRNLGERALSWLRKRDFHILTTGAYIFTNDDRFGISHQAGSDLWTLQIKEAQQRDNGTYECQVPTGNGTLIKKVNLIVVVPEALILGSKEFHVEKGSTISLVCMIEKSPEPPESVMWYHNDKMLNEDASRGGVSVSTVKDTKTHSRLVITDARYSDSGNYMCSADNAKPASIAVFVSGDKTAAIQRRNGASRITTSTWCPANGSWPSMMGLMLLAVLLVLAPAQRISR